MVTYLTFKNIGAADECCFVTIQLRAAMTTSIFNIKSNPFYV